MIPVHVRSQLSTQILFTNEMKRQLKYLLQINPCTRAKRRGPDMLKRRNRAKSGRTLVTLLSKAALVAAFTGGVTPMHAYQFDPIEPYPPSGVKLQVVAFGDSLMDAGTYSPFAELAFGGGRFTTNPGTIFVQDVARYYGDNLTPAFLGGYGLPLVPAAGLDYAQGGSRVKLQPGIDHAAAGTPNAAFAEQTSIPVKDQVSEYLRAYARFRSRQLVMINGGANDVFFNLESAQAAGTESAQQAAVEAIQQAASDLVDVANTVIENGATRVVLFNLPDIGTSPQGVASADHGQLFTQITKLFNTTLTNTLEQRNLTNKVVLIDSFTIIDGIMANFRENGFTVTNTATACNLQAQIANATQLHLKNPDEFGISLFCSPNTFTMKSADQTFMFADMVHPATHLSTLFAHIVEKQLAASELGR
jgi:phospholipase/lecithinase/hemolysin